MSLLSKVLSVGETKTLKSLQRLAARVNDLEPTFERLDDAGLAAQKLERVLLNDPATGVMRHVDAGYELAARVASERGVHVPLAEASPR